MADYGAADEGADVTGGSEQCKDDSSSAAIVPAVESSDVHCITSAEKVHTMLKQGNFVNVVAGNLSAKVGRLSSAEYEYFAREIEDAKNRIESKVNDVSEKKAGLPDHVMLEIIAVLIEKTQGICVKFFEVQYREYNSTL